MLWTRLEMTTQNVSSCIQAEYNEQDCIYFVDRTLCQIEKFISGYLFKKKKKTIVASDDSTYKHSLM